MGLINIICPACGQRVLASPNGGTIRGYCAVAKQHVSISVEKSEAKEDYRHDPEYLAKLRAATLKMWQDPEYRAKQKAALEKKREQTR